MSAGFARRARRAGVDVDAELFAAALREAWYCHMHSLLPTSSQRAILTVAAAQIKSCVRRLEVVETDPDTVRVLADVLDDDTLRTMARDLAGAEHVQAVGARSAVSS